MNPDKPNQHWLFVTYLRPFRARLLVLFALLLSTLGLQIISPVFMSRFIDRAVARQPVHELMLIAGWFLGLKVLEQLISVVENYVAQDLAWSATNNLRADLTRHCLLLGPAFFKEHSAGVMVERIDGDVAQLANFLSRFAVSILGSVLLMVGIVAAVARVDWRIGAILLLFAMLGLFSFNPVRRMIVPRARALRQVQAEWTGFIEESVRGREDVRTCGASGYIVDLLHILHLRILKAARANTVVNTLGWSVGAIIFGLAHAFVMVAGAWLYYSRHATIGTIYLIFNYTMQFLNPLFGIARQVQDVQQSLGSGERIVELFLEQPPIQEGTGATLPDGALSVEFDHVFFEYDAGNPVLQDVSFTLPAGETMAIVGATGSGKSTIVRLIFRFFDITSGLIRIGECGIHEPVLYGLRKRIAMVTQDVQLFRGTLRDNITFFDRQVEDGALLQAVEALGIMPWYQSLPDGLDTYLHGHEGLSAGEAQLVAFVRVYLKKPGLIILDEASARLDPVTAGRVQRATEQLLKGRTAIIIAHRLETTRSVDHVLVMENGGVREYGARRDLEGRVASYYGDLLGGPTETSI